MGYCDQEFEITFRLDNDEAINSVSFTKEIKCELFLDRIEECHGYHAMYEVDEDSLEESIQLFIENQSDNELKELVSMYYEDFRDDDQFVKEIIGIKAI